MEGESSISRRNLLYKSAIVGAAIATAGCSSDNGEPSDESTPDPISQLSVEGFVTADESQENLVTQITATNQTDQSVSADFSAEWELNENKGEITSDTEEITIPADSSEEFQLSMISVDGFTPEKYIGVYYLGFQMEILVNGERQANTCPDTDFSEPNEQGCEYAYGILETHVEVDYGGDWSGAMGGGGSTRTVSKQNSVVSTTTDTAYVNIDDDASIISANAQKQDDSSESLTIRIVHKGEVVAEQSTSAAYGVAQVSETI